MSDNGEPVTEPAQYVQYTLYKLAPEWRRLPAEERSAHKEALAGVVDAWVERITLLTYSLVGIRADADLLLWKLTDRYDDLHDLGAEVNATPIAGWLTPSYSYLAAVKQSKYFERDTRRGPRRVVPRRGPYLVVYPMVKIRPWYALPMEDRVRAMREHAETGQRWPTVTNHTTYSFGIDDQEFMPAFECEEPVDFLELMQALRETEASKYTERDTPIFVGRLEPIRAILDALDGASARVSAGA